MITGANGFIGSAFVSELNRRGITDLVITDTIRPEQRPQLLKGKTYANFLHTDDVFEALEDSSFTRPLKGIVHMGACSTTTEMDVEFLRRNNTEYTQKLFEFCAKKEIPFIYASSGAVYGAGTKGFDDRSVSGIFEPLNPYGWSKLNFDTWVEKVPKNKMPPRWYGLRFFNVYGPNEYFKESMASLVFKAFHQISKTGKLKLFRSHNPKYKDGEQLRDFVYVKDITNWMVQLMDDQKIESGIYNMGFGKARTWLDLAKPVFAALGKPMQIDWIDVPENIRHQYQYFTEAKMDKLFAEGLTTPEWSVEKGVTDYLTNYLMKSEKVL